jgi:hypothetical protein
MIGVWHLLRALVFVQLGKHPAAPWRGGRSGDTIEEMSRILLKSTMR